MRFRGFASFALLLVILAVGTMTLNAAAAPLINCESVGQYDQSVGAGGTITYEWAIYNNDTHPCLVQIYVDNSSTDFQGPGSDGWSIDIEQNYSSLAPGEERQVVVLVETTSNAPSQDQTLNIIMNITELDDPGQMTVIPETVSFHVDSLYGSSGQNKIMGLWVNDLSSPFQSNVAAFFISVLGWVLVALAYVYVIEPIVHQLTKKTETDIDDLLLEAARVPLFLLIVLFGLTNSLEVLYIPNDWMEMIQQTYQFMLIILLTWLVYRVFNDVIIHAIGKIAAKTETEIDDVLVPLLHKVGMIVIPLVAIAVIFKDELGIDPTILIASMGVIGIVIGYAAQSSLSNLFSGLELLMDRPFKIGDIIAIDSGEICEVKHIGLRTTTLYNTNDHDMIILPNNDVANKKVVNYTRPNNHRVITAEVGVAYGTDCPEGQGHPYGHCTGPSRRRQGQ